MARGILCYSLLKNPANVKIKSCWRPYTFSLRNHIRSLQNGGKRSFSTSNGLRKEKAAEVVPGIPYKDLTVGVPKEMWPKEKR